MMTLFIGFPAIAELILIIIVVGIIYFIFRLMKKKRS